MSKEDISKLSSVELVKLGLQDPVKVFIKNEPHKIQKIKDGKLRIISNVSIVDQLIERALCSKQNSKEIEKWASIPSKPGMGLHDIGLRILFACVTVAQGVFGQLVETDISGWDWCVQSWLLEMDMDCRAALYGAPSGSALEHLLWFRGYAVARKVFSLSDGTLLAQTIPGIQASGSYNTSSTNSRMRVMLAWLIGVRWIIAMGDDGVESFLRGAVASYEEYGFHVKDYKPLSAFGVFEFCSTRFEGTWAGYPTQWLRTVYRYLSRSPASHAHSPEYRAQLVDEMRNHPSQQEILSGCDSVVVPESKECH